MQECGSPVLPVERCSALNAVLGSLSGVSEAANRAGPTRTSPGVVKIQLFNKRFIVVPLLCRTAAEGGTNLGDDPGKNFRRRGTSVPLGHSRNS